MLNVFRSSCCIEYEELIVTHLVFFVVVVVVVVVVVIVGKMVFKKAEGFVISNQIGVKFGRIVL